MTTISVYFNWEGKIAIGDRIILSEFPENLYHLGYQFVNKHNNIFLNHNPFVIQGTDVDLDINYSDVNQKFIHNPYSVCSRTEILFDHLNLNTKQITITKPRLYIHENNKKENIITIHTTGKDKIPDNVINHILTKYSKYYTIVQITPANNVKIQGMEHLNYDINIEGSWEKVAELLSKSIMYIGVDSNVSHLALAYTSNVNVYLPSDWIKYFSNQSQPFGNNTIGNIWLHPNNYYFNETNRSHGFTNSYLTL